MTDTAAAATAADERLAYRGPFQRLLTQPEIGSLIGAVAIWGFFWAVTRPFGTAGGTASWLDVSATLGIMAVVVSMLMIGGEFDLSAGAMTGATGIILIMLVKDVGELGGLGLNLFVAVPLSLVAALTIGWFNGTMVEKTSLPSFIVTLATFFVIKGVKLGFAKLLIDNIQVGRVDEGEGYEFWRTVFASTWGRNDHQFEARDLFYNQMLIIGAVLFILAFFEMTFRHRAQAETKFLPLSLGGAGLAILGYIMMHFRRGGDPLYSLLIGVGVVAALYFWSRFRYEPLVAADSLGIPPSTYGLIGGGFAAIAVGIVSALIFDAESEVSLRSIIADEPQKALFLAAVVLVCLVLGGLWALRTDRKSALIRTVSALAAVIALVTVLLLASSEEAREERIDYLTTLLLFTEQGVRALFFVGLVVAGLVALVIGSVRAGRASVRSRSLVQILTAATLAGLAMFIQSQSVSRKFRVELFSVMMLVALLMLAWALVAMFSEQRSGPDSAADRLGKTMLTGGVVLALVGVIIRLLFTTAAEIESGVAPALFSIRIVWFLAVTCVAVWVLAKTRFGSWTFAVGGNKEAARQVGVPAARTKTQLFMIVSAGAWLVGMLLAFRLTTLQASTGDGLEFEYIIAAVVGGSLLNGGYGSALGGAIGALIMAMSKQGIPFAGWNSDWRFVFLGVILLLAVIANNFIRSQAETARK